MRWLWANMEALFGVSLNIWLADSMLFHTVYQRLIINSDGLF